MVLENLAIAKYKERLVNRELTPYDFDYSFESVAATTSAYNKEEMNMRMTNRGFCIMPYWHENTAYDPYVEVLDYQDRQPDVADSEKLELEADLLKYVDKIIALCQDKGVEVIFYRAPYISTANELKKANWFADYCAEKGVVFLDLEKEIEFDLSTDFLDYHHLNDVGAVKATKYLAPYILKAMGT